MPSVTIEKRGKKRRIVWREGGRESKRHIETFPNLPQATKRAKAIRSQLAAKERLPTGRPIPWDQLVARFELSRPGLTPAHLAKATRTLLTLGETRGWKVSSDVTVATTENLRPYHARVLRSLLTYAIGIEQSVDVQVIRKRRPKAAPKVEAQLLAEADVAADIATATKWHPADGAIAHIIARYGHRAESLVGMSVGAVDVKGLALRIKVKSGDTVRRPVTADTIALLKPLMLDENGNDRKPTDPLFIGHHGRPWESGKEYANWWGHSVVPPDPQRKGKRMKGHGIVAMRKRATTMLYRACKDAKTVAEIQGRKTVALVLQIYAQTDDAAMRATLSAAYPASVPPGAT